jgi:hypothetical protein
VLAFIVVNTNKTMKLKDAIDIGKDCGLGTLPEAVNNVLAHQDLLLGHMPDPAKEVRDLIGEAEAAGVQFHDQCGLAMLNGRCYMCEKFQDLFERKLSDTHHIANPDFRKE